MVQADDVTDPENLRWMDDFSNYLLTSREDRTESDYKHSHLYQSRPMVESCLMIKPRIREIIASLPTSVTNAYLSGHNLAVIDVNIGDAQSQSGNGRHGPVDHVVRR